MVPGLIRGYILILVYHTFLSEYHKIFSGCHNKAWLWKLLWSYDIPQPNSNQILVLMTLRYFVGSLWLLVSSLTHPLPQLLLELTFFHILVSPVSNLWHFVSILWHILIKPLLESTLFYNVMTSCYSIMTPLGSLMTSLTKIFLEPTFLTSLLLIVFSLGYMLI